jgi:threonine/homoserine/homoserine lactone efflux protein
VLEVVWLGVLLGAGAAFSVGPIFVTILQTAAVRGFGASVRVILGSAAADLLLVIPAFAFAWLIGAIASAGRWIGLFGAVYFTYLAVMAGRDAFRLTREPVLPPEAGFAFWKGVLANLTNPLTWTFWLATGTPAMTKAMQVGGKPGLVLFTCTWFGVASGLEAVVAFTVARTGRHLGARAQSVLALLSGAFFLTLAIVLFTRDVIER